MMKGITNLHKGFVRFDRCNIKVAILAWALSIPRADVTACLDLASTVRCITKFARQREFQNVFDFFLISEFLSGPQLAALHAFTLLSCKGAG